MQIAHELAQHLLQIKAIKLDIQNPFRWASGRYSPIYCDNRLVLSYPITRKLVISALIDKTKEYPNVSVIAGVATAGIAWGAMLADAMELPYAYVRSKPKDHGLKKLIEGRINGSDKVLLIEDLISTGGSSLEAVQAVRDSGAEVLGVLALFSYEFEESVRRFEENQCNFYSISGYSALLEHALQANYISQSEYISLQEWRQDPIAWSEAYFNKTKTVT